jgi:uncharacterized protein (TIGR00730 family)
MLYATFNLPSFPLATRRHASMMSPTDTVDVAADAALLARIQSELSAATACLGSLVPGITVFGSARTPSDAPDYQSAYRLGRFLARAGLPVVTGGGPGIMGAVNQGAMAVGGVSVGLSISLPHEQSPNPYLTHHLHFSDFQTRKLMLTRYSRGFVVFPGGFGTVDELMELMVAFQTSRSIRKPLVLVGRAFWRGFVDWLTHELGSRHFIELQNMDFIEHADDEHEVLTILLGKDEADALLLQYPHATLTPGEG